MCVLCEKYGEERGRRTNNYVGERHIDFILFIFFFWDEGEIQHHYASAYI